MVDSCLLHLWLFKTQFSQWTILKKLGRAIPKNGVRTREFPCTDSRHLRWCFLQLCLKSFSLDLKYFWWLKSRRINFEKAKQTPVLRKALHEADIDVPALINEVELLLASVATDVKISRLRKRGETRHEEWYANKEVPPALLFSWLM